MKTALITGASRGLGRALTTALAADGWYIVVDARHRAGLDELLAGIPDSDGVVAIAGDVGDPAHRSALIAAADRFGRLDALINNASTLGPTPLSPLAAADLTRLAEVFQINTFAPIELANGLLHLLSPSHGAVLNVSSDAGAAHYETWGLYGASKAALDHLTLTFAAESAETNWYAVDPGDMRTQMQQQAFPGDDISDRAQPASVVPAFIRILEERPPSGRYRAVDLMTAGAAR
jgi:NAD(P)-dependent dehydrogenase (short-subunit alcohol dehydrogenase family)